MSIHAPAGYAMHMRGIISGLEALGHTVIPVIIGDLNKSGRVVSDPSPGTFSFKRKIKSFIPKLIWESLKDYQLLNTDQKNVAILENMVKEHRPDVIYERLNYLQASGVIVAQKYGIQHISELNAPYVEERIELQGYSLFLGKAHRINQEVFEKTSLITPVSEALKRYVVKNYGISPYKITSVPNGINLEKVNIDPSKIDRIRTTYPSIKDRFVLGFVGSIQKWHGVDILIQAFHVFQKKYPNSMLMMVGDGETLASYKKLSLDLDLSEHIIFTGNVPIDEVYNYMSVMDLLLLSNTHWYCSPIKIFEYAAIQKPMVLVKTEAVEEIFRHDQEAYLTEADPKKIADGCLKIAQNPDYAQSLANHAYTRLKEQFTWAKNAEKILNSLTKA